MSHENQCHGRRPSPHACFHFKQQLTADSAANFGVSALEQGQQALFSGGCLPKQLEPHSLQRDHSCYSPNLSHWLFLLRSEPGRVKEGGKARNRMERLPAAQGISTGILGGINVFPSAFCLSLLTVENTKAAKLEVQYGQGRKTY